MRKASLLNHELTKSEAKVQQLQDEIEKLKNDQQLLQSWFFLDKSSRPHKYKLQPIRFHLLF